MNDDDKLNVVKDVIDQTNDVNCLLSMFYLLLMKLMPLLACTTRDAAATPKKTRQRKARRPRNTKWMKIERKAVEEYANDPKRNKSGKQPHELCETVWRMNKAEFDTAAKLPKEKRGYANCKSLKNHFYKRGRIFSAHEYPLAMNEETTRNSK